jgi:ABC-type lipoprotein release transport system permease subunit
LRAVDTGIPACAGLICGDVAVLLLVVALACIKPAWRAMRLNRAAVLRE